MRTSQRTVTTLLAAITCAVPLAVSATGALAAAAVGGEVAPSASAAPAPTMKHRIRPSGIATWFGPGFFGNQTACGQTLTPGVIGVANRTLPCGTLVRISYAGHALTVPVLDRGPYSHIGADWDLTAAAAQALGISETVHIRARVVGKTVNTPSLGQPIVPLGTVVAGGALAG